MLLKNLFLTSFIAALLLCLSAPASAEVSIGYAQDVVHAPETGAAIVRYDHEPTRLGGQAMYWDGPDHHNMSLGLDYDLIPSKTVDLNLGGVFIKNVNGINGTHFTWANTPGSSSRISRTAAPETTTAGTLSASS